MKLHSKSLLVVGCVELGFTTDSQPAIREVVLNSSERLAG